MHLDETSYNGFEWRSKFYLNFWNRNQHSEFNQLFIDVSFKSIVYITVVQKDYYLNIHGKALRARN